MIDFELYRIFVAVAKEENITKASAKLNISQPAVTKQIKNLEKQLTLKLFDRKSKGLSLTAEGKELYAKVKNPIEELNRIDELLTKEKFINIGTHNHMGSCIFGDVINKYCLKYPNVKLNLICEETSEMMKKLRNEIKKEKGSITVLVIASFFVIIAVFINLYIIGTNKSNSQEKEIKAIQEAYNVSTDRMEEEYQNAK